MEVNSIFSEFLGELSSYFKSAVFFFVEVEELSANSSENLFFKFFSFLLKQDLLTQQFKLCLKKQNHFRSYDNFELLLLEEGKMMNQITLEKCRDPFVSCISTVFENH